MCNRPGPLMVTARPGCLTGQRLASGQIVKNELYPDGVPGILPACGSVPAGGGDAENMRRGCRIILRRARGTGVLAATA